jgi:hypothetical protein
MMHIVQSCDISVKFSVLLLDILITKSALKKLFVILFSDINVNRILRRYRARIVSIH